jgi:hypothetical protein
MWGRKAEQAGPDAGVGLARSECEKLARLRKRVARLMRVHGIVRLHLCGNKRTMIPPDHSAWP